ncbi:glycosyltransferase family 2 protein [Methylobacterium sp. E-065]|uniref:glycosyltransferase family 2 protein n=1 Tax=Methylobacterium sp. E-065 TaxID=2836583 RepID=UPI001FB90AA9|nr:glycosyltransferase family 2 protein [Methylobacterium sp. E-065]MCJ2017140.1 glycosyltransferase family 2 protein [Methylobacterium sp. E-065]
MSEAAPATYRAKLERTGPRSLSGYCYDTSDLSRRIIVELRIDGIGTAWTQADGFVDSLTEAGVGDGRYGFSFIVAPETVAGGGCAQIVVANTTVTPARPLALVPGGGAVARDEGAGWVRWVGGRQLSGWLIEQLGSQGGEVRVSLDGQLIARAPADRWHHLQEPGGARPVPGFDLHLPAAVADGTVKRVVVTDGAGRPLRGSPLSLVAFPDPLTAAVEQLYGPEVGATRARAQLFETLLPNSWPLMDSAGWLQRYPVATPEVAPPTALIIIGDEATAVDVTLASLNQQPGLPWVAAALPSPDRVGFRPDDLGDFLSGDAGRCTALLAVPAGAAFLPGRAARLTAALAEAPDAPLVYGDVSIGDASMETLLAFPSFDYERWLEQGYGALTFGLPIASAQQAVRAGADSLYRLANAPLDHALGRWDAVIHLPGIAARVPHLDLDAASAHLASATRRHLETSAIPATVTVGRGSILPAARISRAPPPGLVSIIIPTRDRADLLERCLASIRAARVQYGCELLIVDNGSSDPATHALFAAVRAEGGHVLTDPGPFNYARLCNRAVETAQGDFVLFLNNDVEMVGDSWLHELLGRLAEPTAEAVGGVLRWPSGVVQHGGVVLGPGFSASHAFDDRYYGDPGYGDLLRVASQPSAVTGACLLVRRSSYQAVGGMDAIHFPVNFNDVDLCLKLGARGGRVVLTPHLEAVHLGSASRGLDRRPDQRSRYARELTALRARWGDVLQADPAYSPLLALSDNPYTALACPPRTLTPRGRQIVAGRDIPNGL